MNDADCGKMLVIVMKSSYLIIVLYQQGGLLHQWPEKEDENPSSLSSLLSKRWESECRNIILTSTSSILNHILYGENYRKR